MYGLNLFSRHQVRSLDIQNQVVILMVLIAVEVLEVVEGMVIMIPVTNDDTRISLSVEVLEGMKSWSNLAGNNPLEMMSSRNLRDFSEMEV
jgi:hypothetical protein